MIQFEHYSDRLYSIRIQFEFMRKAIKSFITQTEPDAETPVQKTVSGVIAVLLKKTTEEEKVKALMEAYELTKGGFPNKYKGLENRIAQNEVILIVAVLEDQMKAIHREVLRQNPKLLNPDRLIKLGKLVALTPEKVIEEEIEATVQALDRESVEKRAKTFEKIGLPWTKPSIKKVEEITVLRNRILHEDIEVHVSGLQLNQSFVTAFGLPLHLYREAQRLYPEGFDTGMSVAEQQYLRVMVQKAMRNQTQDQSE